MVIGTLIDLGWRIRRAYKMRCVVDELELKKKKTRSHQMCS